MATICRTGPPSRETVPDRFTYEVEEPLGQVQQAAVSLLICRAGLPPASANHRWSSRMTVKSSD
jgi:hypothetical protein